MVVVGLAAGIGTLMEVAQAPATPARALCFPCAPATFGKVAPVGSFPWQDAQAATDSGEPAW